MMNSQSLFCLAVFILPFLFIMLSPTHSLSQPSRITINNGCPYTIWPAIQTRVGKELRNSGFLLPTHEQVIFDVEMPWSGRIWGRTECLFESDDKFHCKVGDCGTGEEECYGQPNYPVSVVDLIMAPTNGTSHYAIDLINGANVPVNVVPTDFRNCGEIQCYTDLTTYCPDWLTKFDDTGKRIGCKSTCLATEEPKHCCTGEFASFQTCNWNAYDQFIYTNCPDAMSSPFRSSEKNFSCHGGIGFGIYFCG